MRSADGFATTTTGSSDEASGPNDAGVGDEGAYDVDSDMRFSHHDLAVAPTASTFPKLTFRLDVQSWTGREVDQVFIAVSGGDFDGLTAALCEDPTVADHRLVADFETERLYRIHVAEGAKRIRPLFDGVNAVVRDAKCTPEGWTVRAHLATRDALTDLTSKCREFDIRIDVIRLSRMGSIEDPDSAVLSAEQRELLTTAIDHGYFETPRGISQNDLATMFDVSPSAISQRLRTATGKLVAHNLGTR